MIVWVDEGAHYQKTGELPSLGTPIHILMREDGYPMCWAKPIDEPYAGSYEAVEADCKKCLDAFISRI